MTDHPSPDVLTDLENQLRILGRAIPYPQTPDIAAARTARLGQKSPPQGLRWGIVLIIILALSAALLAVPPVRAAVSDFIQLGAIRILLGDILREDQQHPLPTSAVGPTDQLGAGFHFQRWQELAGEVSLDAAERRTGHSLPLPIFPSELGGPDHVFVQENGGMIVLLLWNGSGSEELTLSMLILGPGAFVGKGTPPTILKTTVKGREALWLEGDHDLLLMSGEPARETLFRVGGNVLIWEEAGVTYRIEGDFSLEYAIRIAESLP